MHGWAQRKSPVHFWGGFYRFHSGSLPGSLLAYRLALCGFMWLYVACFMWLEWRVGLTQGPPLCV